MGFIAMVVTFLIIAAVVCAFIVISVYNTLVRLRQNRENAFANVDVQLQQRYDMIPQLIDTVKGAIKHENETLTKVIQARSGGLAATTISDKIEADRNLTSALKELKVVIESYPDLKANTAFMNLQNEIVDTENKLGAARRFFNSATKEYNTACEIFPNVVLAERFGHKKEPMFDVTLTGVDRMTANQATKVSF